MVTAEQIRHALLEMALGLHRTAFTVKNRAKDPAVVLAEAINRQPVEVRKRRVRKTNAAEGIAVPVPWKGKRRSDSDGLASNEAIVPE